MNDLRIVLPKKSAFSIETPDHFPKLHQLSAIVASRGGGKSVLCSSLLQAFKRVGKMDRVFLISPTIGSNKEIFEPLEIAEEDQYLEPSKESVLSVIEKVESEAKEWVAIEKKIELHRLLKQLGRDAPRDLIQKALQGGYYYQAPKSKYGHRPSLALIVDDAQGSSIYGQSTKNPFINLCLRHRHVGDGLGLSIFMLAQSYNSPSGIPRSIRQNITTLFLGRQKNLDVIEQIANELGGSIKREDFLDIFQKAIQNEHDFLCIDFAPKKEEYRFRRNLNEFLS
jgi:hypothetical protein